MSLMPFREEDLLFPEGRFYELFIQSWSDAEREIKIMGFTKASLINFSHTTDADRSIKSQTFKLQGIPLGIEAVAWTTPVQNGRCFINMFLLAGGVRLFSLGSGYLSDGKQISWPPAKHTPMGSGPGFLRSITGTDPAAGAEVTETVPTNARWRLVFARAILVTDATVANRRCNWLIDDGVNTFVAADDAYDQTASTTISHCLSAIQVRGGIGTDVNTQLPSVPLFLFQGWRVRTSTTNLQAGDNYGAPRLLVEEWIEE